MREHLGESESARLLLSTQDAAKVLSLSDRNVRELIATGELLSIKVGRRRLVPQSALVAFVAKRMATADAA